MSACDVCALYVHQRQGYRVCRRCRKRTHVRCAARHRCEPSASLWSDRAAPYVTALLAARLAADREAVAT